MGVDSTRTLERLYRAAVGPRRADYYAPKFLRFDQPGASKISWNWSAFVPVVSFFWFLYRRMYGYWVVFCLLIPLALTLCVAIVAAVFRDSRITWAVEIAGLAYSDLLIPMFANALYHRQIKRRIESLSRRVPDPAVQVTVLENAPHTSAIAWLIVLFASIPLTGILAAIAIPAYQDYTLRAQIAEGLRLAKPLEATIEEHYQAEHHWPLDLSDLGISPPPSGRYVAAIRLDRGTLSITYGNQANRLISGHVLSVRPSLVAPDRVLWTCGYAAHSGKDPGSDPAGVAQTDIRRNYLPPFCR